MTTVEDFMPKYPNIHDLSEAEFLNPYNDGESFEEIIFKKREFFEERLPIEETGLMQPGTLMKHQKIISRFLSDHTIYNSLLLFHETGTGKSCVTVGVVENIRNSHPNNEFTGALVLAPRDKLLRNYKDEIIFKCTDGRYKPDDYESLKPEQKTKRINAQLKGFYQFDTYEKFAKKIGATSASSRLSDEAIISQYSYKIIILDEVHHLTEKPERQRADTAATGIDKYKAIYRFLHLVKNCKIMIMSATPMKDDPSEIAPLMNLILPQGDLLPVKDRFKLEFFPEESGGEIVNVDVLKEAFKGRVSHIKSMPSSVRKVYMGEQLDDLQLLPVVGCMMSDFQTRYYNAAYIDDTEGESGGVYSNSQQASLFVFPPLAEGEADGLSGTSVFNKSGSNKTYIETRTPSRLGGIKKQTSYSLSTAFKNWLRHGDEDEQTNILNNIAKCSCMYADTLRNILRASDEGRNTFVYCSYVYGSGIILFSLLLNLLGFSKASSTSGPAGINSKRYFLASNTASSEMDKLKERFNEPGNKNGRDISVILGSGVVSEGFTFENIQEIQILTPHWNYSETVQAIGRGLRLNSHKSLLQSGENDIQVRIYQRVPLPNDGAPSIFLRMYAISEKKDVQIKKIERIMKTSAFDCALAYQRNHRQGYDGQRDCDYMECDYVCEGFNSTDEYSSPPLPPPESNAVGNIQLDDTTYRLYYNGPLIEQLKVFVTQELFLLHLSSSSESEAVFRISLSKIEEVVNSTQIVEQIFEDGSRVITTFEILTALREIINDNIPVLDKYGLVSYLRERNNIYYLLRQVSHSEDPSLSYYTKNLSLWSGYSYQEAVDSIGKDKMPDRITEICTINDFDEFQKAFESLPREIQNSMIEQCIEVADAIRRSISLRTSGNPTIREFVNKIAADDIFLLDDGTVVNTFPESNMKSIENAKNRWLVQGKWKEHDPFLYYMDAEYDALTDENPGATAKEVNQELQRRWDKMPKDQKAPYQQKSENELAKIEEKIRLKKKAHLERFFNSPYRYYGIWNSKQNKFWVADTKGVNLDATVDGRGGKGGAGKTRDCKSWSKPEILAILLSLSVDIPDDVPERMLTLTEVQEGLNSDARKVLSLGDLDSTTQSLLGSLDGKQRLLYWCKDSHASLCETLRNWFREHDLLDTSNINIKSVLKNKSKEKIKSKKIKNRKKAVKKRKRLKK